MQVVARGPAVGGPTAETRGIRQVMVGCLAADVAVSSGSVDWRSDRGGQTEVGYQWSDWSEV